MDPNRPTLRHIIIKTPKVKYKEILLKAARDKQLVTYKGAPVRLSTNFSKEILQARRDWQEILSHEKQEYNQDTLPSKAII